MATSNFHNVNASTIYAISLDHEESYNDLEYDILSSLENLSAKDKEIGFYSKYGTDTEELRSYPSTVLGTLFMNKDYSDFGVRVSVIAVVRSAYYEGCNLDYVFDFDVNGTNTDELDFTDILEYEFSRKMAEHKAQFAQKWAKKALASMVEKLEKIYEERSTKLAVVARFSNGETIYEEQN